MTSTNVVCDAQIPFDEDSGTMEKEKTQSFGRPLPTAVTETVVQGEGRFAGWGYFKDETKSSLLSFMELCNTLWSLVIPPSFHSKSLTLNG